MHLSSRVVQVTEMEPLRSPQIEVETIWRTILVTDARDSSKAYFSDRAEEALVRIERDRALFAQIAAHFGGEEARDRGDGSMFAFCDPVEALRAAMKMQEEVGRRNAELPDEVLHLTHRMGIHIGQIKLAKTRLAGSEVVRRKLSGDIVVTATRLEEICHPGEVCFSNDVYRVVRSEFDHPFRHLDTTLKGFSRPIRTWSTRLDPGWERPLTTEEEIVRNRRAEEKRLRERWEREQQERHTRDLALRGAAWFAGVSLVFAGFRIVQTASDFDTRVARAWAALLTPAERVQTVREMPIYGTMAVARKPARHPARVAESRHTNHRMAPVKKAVNDAQRVQRAKDWLAGRLATAAGQPAQGLALEPPLAGMAVVTHADEQGIGGRDGTDRQRSILYRQLEPQDFKRILRAAAKNGAAPPDDPDECASSLAALRNLID